MSLGASTEENGASGEVFFANADYAVRGFSSDLSLTAESFNGSFSLDDAETEEPTGRTAIVNATFTKGPHVTLLSEENGIRSKKIGNIPIPTGTITFSTDPATVVDLSSCFAFDGSEHQKQHRPSE